MPLENLRLLKGESDLTEYSWVPDDKPKANLHYRFCKHCGIRVFARGDDNGHGEPFYGVAISTLEGTDADELVASLTYIDGANDKFDSRPDDIRLM